MNVESVIVGLGNPGPRYAFTRHNIGFIALDVLAQDARAKFSKSSLGKSINAETAEISVAQKKVLLIKPMTYMNLSGESVAKLYAQFNHLRPKPLIVVQDEADLALGRIRVKKGGSDAGHNGLKSLREHLGHGDYYRVRLGVGRPTPESGMALADHVLKAFSKDEEDLLIRMITQCRGVLEALVEEKLTEAQAIASKDLLQTIL